jgi:DNA-directed RNA polymerase specialized sigma24 family protein
MRSMIAIAWHRQQISDLVQETLITVHNKHHTYDPSQPFGPWLAAIARYKWADYLRELYRQ